MMPKDELTMKVMATIAMMMLVARCLLSIVVISWSMLIALVPTVDLELIVHLWALQLYATLHRNGHHRTRLDAARRANAQIAT